MSILNYEATSDDGFGNIEKVTAQTEPSKARFNPMQSWMNASKVIDQEFSRPPANIVGTPTMDQTFDVWGGIDPKTVQEIPQEQIGALIKAANVPSDIQPYSEYGGTSAQTFGLGNPEPVQPYDQMSQNPMGGLPPASMQPPQQDPAALGFANMPYDLTGGPSQGATPDPVQAAALGSMYSPEAVEAQVMQDQQVMGGSGYTRPMTPEMSPFGSMDVLQGATADQQFDQGAMQPSPTPFDDDWMRAQEQGGSNPQQIQRADAITKAASMQNDGSNTSGGVDASNDPIMVSRLGPLASDPAKRREAYMKRLNTAFMQSIALDAMASVLGVKSRSGQFMEMTQKAIDAEMKFDDEQRLAEINRAVFFPNGVYSPPVNKRDAFDRAIAAGATPEEASSISGYMPDDKEIPGIKEIFRSTPEGTIENRFIPDGQVPPPGWTFKSDVAKIQAGQNNTLGKTPSAMQIEAEVNRLSENADAAEASGNLEEAERLRTRANNLLRLGRGASTSDEFDYGAARQTFKDMYGAQISESANYMTEDNTFRNEKGEFIPWDIFRQRWLNSYEIKVMDENGGIVSRPGWLQIKADPTEHASQLEIPTVTNKQQYDALPSGTRFYDSQGTMGIKP